MLIDHFFDVSMNHRPIGFYIDNDSTHNPHLANDLIVSAMGFVSFEDYIASVPGYSIYTELTYWEDNSHRSFSVRPSNKDCKYVSYWANLTHSDEFPYIERHAYWLSNIHSYGGFPFILPDVDKMIGLERYKNLKRNDLTFSCCRDWSEDDE